jgi:hypothetical protein
MSNKKLSFVLFLGLVMSPSLYGQRKADLSRLVAAGDSLTAGYQNAQLIGTSQVHSYANVIATQAGVSLNLPLLAAPGYPQIIIEDNFAVVTGAAPVALPKLYQPPTLDVAVPGFKVADLVGAPASCPPNDLNVIDVLTVEILNPTCSLTPPPTQLSEAASLKPTTSILWIGSNDALYTLLYGSAPTDISSFFQAYNVAATTLAHASGHMVLANIPDVTLTAYLTSVTSVPELAAILGLPVAEVEAIFGLGPNDKVTPYAFAAIQAMGVNLTTLPVSSPQGPIVIRASTISQIRTAIFEYNLVIAGEAIVNGATLVDIYTLVNNLAANGIVVSGTKLTTEFGGGLFSLDGVHPTNVGYAIIANQFIQTMNQTLGTNIPPVSLAQVATTDPLFPHSVKPAAHVSPGMADGLRATLRRAQP